MQSMAWSLLMMFIVLAMIPLVLWTVKKMQTIRPAGAQRLLDVVAQLPLGPRERVVLVRVQGRVLVLGATAQQITLLAEADPVADTGGEATVPAALPEGFAGMLKNLGVNLPPQRSRK